MRLERRPSGRERPTLKPREKLDSFTASSSTESGQGEDPRAYQ